nr:conjugal transfer protein traG [Bradyrhizobium sp. DOA9]
MHLPAGDGPKGTIHVSDKDHLAPGFPVLLGCACVSLGIDRMDRLAASVSATPRGAMVHGWWLARLSAGGLFEWWFKFGAYAPRTFVEGGAIAASGGIAHRACHGAFGPARRRGEERHTYCLATVGPYAGSERAGLLGHDGIVLGRFEGRYLRHDGPEHVLCFAPTRSGNGVGLIIPTLLTSPASTIIHDIKGENFQLTSGWHSIRDRIAVRSDQSGERPPTNHCLRSAAAIAR